MRKLLYSALTALLSLGTPIVAFAHEVYVLTPKEIQDAITAPRFSEIPVITSNLEQFIFWALVSVGIVTAVFLISISRKLENLLDPILAKLPPYAPVIGRVAIGLSLITAAYYGSLFGPELPLSESFGAFSGAVSLLLVISGIMILVGFYSRIATFVILILFGIEIYIHGHYMFTYSNHLGELIVLLILGAHKIAYHHKGHDIMRAPKWFMKLKRALMPYAFLILRVGFGVALLYSALYAKVIYNNLALSVAYNHPTLVQFFGFEPHFLVLGAAVIEIVIAIFFIIGFEIRFASLFMIFWLSLSLWYFGEAVWPHLILAGIPMAFIFYGYDKYSVEGWFFKRGGREPVL